MENPPRQFFHPRQQRTQGFDIKLLRKTSKKTRSFPIDDEEFNARKKARLEDDNCEAAIQDFKLKGLNKSRSASVDIDPSRLCPFCDRLFPEETTSQLDDLLARALQRSYRDPRPKNSLGRRANLEVFAALCERHTFEKELVPKAVANGWPTSIDWASVKARVMALHGPLGDILHDQGRRIAYGGATTFHETFVTGPRMECVFWQEVVAELEMYGSRRVSGIGGQYASFSRTQPGYYGGLGAIVMSETLYMMFPAKTVSSHWVEPFSLQEFIGRILVPEAAMRLIMEDMGLDGSDAGNKGKAIEVMRASTSYGSYMFADDSSHDLSS
ncbi:RTC4-like domain-containing protein [Mycena alexandri]|uniref:Restriction of telomere capping protein 4 n=1 Tax=Mycena alexandri TaxID=1745969 RepID=A0AAD6T1A8_9AGAR|nr:RTC4-like domain-containing protein [Mycena alexandri]